MSFRARLALFFVLLVLIPIAAIAVLVVDVVGESQAGKADARLSTGLEAALSIYERNAAEAKSGVRELLAGSQGGAGPRSASFARDARDSGLEYLRVTAMSGEELVSFGSFRPVAVATVHATTASGGFNVEASTTNPAEYLADVTTTTGLSAALADDGGVVATTSDLELTEAPPPSGSADITIGDQTQRVASASLADRGGLRVAVFTELEQGGFFGSRPRVGIALVAFLAIALGLILLTARGLQARVGAMLAAARRIGSGDFSQRIPVAGRDEFAGLAAEFNKMTDQLETQIDQLRRQRVELDRSVNRLGEAFASGLDRDALLGIVAETALGACQAEYCRVALADGVLIERPGKVSGATREAARAAERRSARDRGEVDARREGAHALAAPLRRLGRREDAEGTISIARLGERFSASERDVFLYLIGQASASLENISAHERVTEQAVTDELTGLANNRAFREVIDREAARAERFGHKLSLIILDLDDFKAINDTHGHLQGDEVLRAVGRVLASEPRAIDEPARYGGEEFVVALPETGLEGALELAERIRKRIEAEPVSMLDGDRTLSITASLGIATLPDCATDVRGLLTAADEALYEAKRSGKNRVVSAKPVETPVKPPARR